jgi:hypothetical protein
VHNPDYHRHPVPHEMYVPDHYANLAAELAEQMEAEAQSGEAKASAAAGN